MEEGCRKSDGYFTEDRKEEGSFPLYRR